MSEERRSGGDRRGMVPMTITKVEKPGARIFFHPRCVAGPAFGACVAGLEEHGVDFANKRLFAAFGNKHELVNIVEETGAVTTYQRLDGVQFKHRMGQTSPEPEMA